MSDDRRCRLSLEMDFPVAQLEEVIRMLREIEQSAPKDIHVAILIQSGILPTEAMEMMKRLIPDLKTSYFERKKPEDN